VASSISATTVVGANDCASVGETALRKTDGASGHQLRLLKPLATEWVDERDHAVSEAGDH
jgi:hypothetical protein